MTEEEFYKHFDMSEPSLARIHTGLFKEYDDDQNGVVTTSDIEAVYNRMDMDSTFTCSWSYRDSRRWGGGGRKEDGQKTARVS